MINTYSYLKVIHSNDYHEFYILNIKEKGAYTYLLDRIELLFEHTCHIRSKNFMFILTLNFPKGYNSDGSNKEIQKFTHSYSKRLKRLGLNPFYLWVREKNKSENHHYHLLMILDGQKTQNSHGHLQKAKEVWGNIVGVSNEQAAVHLSKQGTHGGIMITSTKKITDVDSYADAFQRASYLAKVYTKDDTCRISGSSLLPTKVIKPEFNALPPISKF